MSGGKVCWGPIGQIPRKLQFLGISLEEKLSLVDFLESKGKSKIMNINRARIYTCMYLFYQLTDKTNTYMLTSAECGGGDWAN